MKHQEQRQITRHELAAMLRQLAAQWERGEVVVGNAHAAVPEVARLKMSLAVGEARVELRIEVAWPPEAAHRLA